MASESTIAASVDALEDGMREGLPTFEVMLLIRQVAEDMAGHPDEAWLREVLWGALNQHPALRAAGILAVIAGEVRTDEEIRVHVTESEADFRPIRGPGFGDEKFAAWSDGN